MIEGSRRWWLIVAAAALVCVQIPVLVRTATDPTQSDFGNYFTPAFALSRGYALGGLYDANTFAAVRNEAGIEGLGSFVPHPPVNALWLLPFAHLSPARAKLLWTGILLLASGLCTLFVHRLWPRYGMAMAVVVVLAPSLAIRNGLVFAQPYLVLTALLTAAALALERGRFSLAAFLLGLSVPFKPYAAMSGFLFVHRDRRESLASFLAGVLTPLLVLWGLQGPAPFVEFADKVLPWMLRGDIQDPFAPGWGSAVALANRLLRFEADLNPQPWFRTPLLARFVGAMVTSTLLAIGVFAGRRALGSGKRLDAVGATLVCAVAASPFAASYHLVLLVVPVLSVALRLQDRLLALWLLGWAFVGSSAMNVFRSLGEVWAPLPYARFAALLGMALAVVWPYLGRQVIVRALAAGVFGGVLGLPWGRNEEAWTRVEADSGGYSMFRPHFCGEVLRWWSPSGDGQALEARGSGQECAASPIAPTSRPGVDGGSVLSRFASGSWNLYLRPSHGAQDVRLTFSDANEVDPVFTPEGCTVVFASDQGRGLGSTALYSIDVSRIMAGCEGVAPASAPQ